MSEGAADGRDPGAPKQTIEERARTQVTFLQEKLEPVLAQAKAKRRSAFFVGAAHFVRGRSCAASGAWCGCWPGGVGAPAVQRPRGLNGVTRELIRMSNGTRVPSGTMVEPSGGSRHRPRGQRRWCWTTRGASGVMRKRLGIELLFLPPYSPNSNLIERL